MIEKLIAVISFRFRQMWLLALLLLPASLVFSQYTVRINVKKVPGTHLSDAVYIAGTFNQWNPSDPESLFSFSDSSLHFYSDGVSGGEYQFKFTRGSWDKVEVNADGSDVQNRFVTLSSDTVLEYTIAAWKDDFAKREKVHTASVNVRMLDSSFAMPELGSNRRIWLYLPPGYAKTKKRYPVMYMHDGQNIFDEYIAPFGEWGVDECLDSFANKNLAECIVVGIDNGPRRMTEYNPFEFRDFGKGEGDQYVDFIANTLKPFVDKRFRTLTSKQNTIIAGSSMGGLISYYAMLKYPETFGKAGIFSPAFWTADKVKVLTEENGSKLKGKLFFYMGGKEGGSYIKDMNDVTDLLGKHSPAMIYAVIDPDAAHNEQAWRKWFPEFYKWIMADGFNAIIKVD